uniref:Uncharacterized protein n=1 Tax=Trypanosoma congolense (strain IL3000) TaxID=1068625 RepID=G0UZY4_TRYCI|nr:hypothetical protein, unlikely [Trypanosoma congolense IL3000]
MLHNYDILYFFLHLDLCKTINDMVKISPHGIQGVSGSDGIIMLFPVRFYLFSTNCITTIFGVNIAWSLLELNIRKCKRASSLYILKYCCYFPCFFRIDHVDRSNGMSFV